MSESNSGPGAPQDNEQGHADTVTPEKPGNASDTQPEGNNSNSADGDVFPRSYVEELRKESAEHRTKAKDAEAKADELARRLHRELVSAAARLENPDDLPYAVKHLDDPAKLTAALDALLADRPYLAKRVVKGDVGQGDRGGSAGGPSFADLFRRH